MTMRDSRNRIERGDKMGCVCRNCGEKYTYIEKVEQDPPRSTSRCPDCHALYHGIKDSGARVAGTWRIRDDDTRDELISAIEENTPYKVFVEERVNDLHVYDPEELDDDE